MSDLISRSDSYMNDLIRRKDILALFPTNDCSDKMIELYERVLDIPTAYDAEKVVTELEQNQDNIQGNTSLHDFYSEGYSNAIDDAIDIVRKGGVK